MKRLNAKTPKRLKTTKSDILALLVIAPLILIFPCFVIGAIGIELDRLWLGLIFIFSAMAMAGVIILIVVICVIKEIKAYGNNRWIAEFNGELTPQQKSETGSFLQGCGFLVEEQNGETCFSRAVNGFIVQYIIIFNSNEKIILEAFCTSTTIMTSVKEIGLYGFSGLIPKRKLRKNIAGLLDILNAPHNIMV